ncbi:unnamed protein product [Trichobilharzia regenti]|nr:unnamed protein product [Trichobilharzia regenti]
MDFQKPLAGVTSMSIVPLPGKKPGKDAPGMAITSFSSGVFKSSSQIIPAGQQGSVPRTSNLMSPNMLLNGHEGEVYCGKFSSDGSFLASAGFDRRIQLWETYGECENISTMMGKFCSFIVEHDLSKYVFSVNSHQALHVHNEVSDCSRRLDK